MSYYGRHSICFSKLIKLIDPHRYSENLVRGDVRCGCVVLLFVFAFVVVCVACCCVVLLFVFAFVLLLFFVVFVCCRLLLVVFIVLLVPLPRPPRRRPQSVACEKCANVHGNDQNENVGTLRPFRLDMLQVESRLVQVGRIEQMPRNDSKLLHSQSPYWELFSLSLSLSLLGPSTGE